MAVSDLIDIKKFKELRRSDPIKAKNLMKKIKKKNAKKLKQEKKDELPNKLHDATVPKHEVYAEYVEEEIDEGMMENFEDVYKRFKVVKENEGENEHPVEEDKKIIMDEFYTDNEDEEEEKEMKNNEFISKKALKLLKRPSIMKLKEFATRPELVDIWDTTANDPYFCVWLKCLKNSVPVPQQWCQKRKYMHGKRGIEKLPYVLPPYIEDTKISEIRQAIKEKEQQKSLKQKMRDRVRPKLHTMDIDYQTLHDAFFKYATKPKLVKFADVYYEGKEFELKTKKFRPGVISERLRKALNIQPNDPLPWLVNMQKYGLPPSFPYLNIPSLNELTKDMNTRNINKTGQNTMFNANNPNQENAGLPSSGVGNGTTSDFTANQNRQGTNLKTKYESVDESGNIIYGNFISQRNNDTSNNKYADEFLWGEISEHFESSEEEEEEEEDNEKGSKDDEIVNSDDDEKKSRNIEYKDKNNIMDYPENINLSDNLNDDLLKNNYAQGTYSVGANSKMTGSYTPYMENGLTSVDLTSFVPGYETPKYGYNNNYINAQNFKPYTVLQREEVPISQNNLFSSNAKYKINPPIQHISNTPNISEAGISTPFTNIGIATPHMKNEIGKGLNANTNNSTIDDIRKELNKCEETSNKIKLMSAQVDNPKKTTKDDKQKKKKRFFKF
ncbi:splicing factor 3B subunit 2, putative [Plasmodium yoelii]|uniref:Splicing factor 3B subunit 2 n=3 Tax=Plasmodium yoelii TaxID=5861 RepID=A0AAE9X0P8_PLAYO|nr:splicing factor 3B subunit 2, putative [Plasmodium yoelii]WBY59974.1 splicing factor 3B subunit 2 [Plasmodium yoelii yoelii]CDU19911.1 splicing factor 3B subunit 2, putative [Plasmodium yoelii]VTZ80668.1 splicing factor 3B subunit 2, putative [Plasmodium yoelii]|eukprot:XP_022813589.1 splicing factor 3B subunit 2, putative [Plasmodium yoelii]